MCKAFKNGTGCPLTCAICSISLYYTRFSFFLFALYLQCVSTADEAKFELKIIQATIQATENQCCMLNLWKSGVACSWSGVCEWNTASIVWLCYNCLMVSGSGCWSAETNCKNKPVMDMLAFQVPVINGSIDLLVNIWSLSQLLCRKCILKLDWWICSKIYDL